VELLRERITLAQDRWNKGLKDILDKFSSLGELETFLIDWLSSNCWEFPALIYDYESLPKYNCQNDIRLLSHRHRRMRLISKISYLGMVTWTVILITLAFLSGWKMLAGIWTLGPPFIWAFGVFQPRRRYKQQFYECVNRISDKLLRIVDIYRSSAKGWIEAFLRKQLGEFLQKVEYYRRQLEILLRLFRPSISLDKFENYKFPQPPEADLDIHISLKGVLDGKLQDLEQIQKIKNGIESEWNSWSAPSREHLEVLRALQRRISDIELPIAFKREVAAKLHSEDRYVAFLPTSYGETPYMGLSVEWLDSNAGMFIGYMRIISEIK
jgi:hypothetical protein